MALQVLVTFPGTMTLGAFEDRVKLLKKMGCAIHLGTDLAQPLGEMKIANVFKTKKTTSDVMTEELSPQEISLLDQGLQAIYDSKSSPLLDAMEMSGSLRTRPNMTQEIKKFFKENPGQSSNVAAAALANKFEANYRDINDAYKRIKSLISSMSSPNSPQHALDKRGGWGAQAQIFLLA